MESRRQLGDLVQEDRALVGAAEEAERVGHGVREGPADVTEELGLEQVFRDGAAVHRNEGPLGATGEPVDRRGDQLLPRPALALNEHRRVRGRDFADDLVHASAAHCRRAR